ncbi:MAG: co-chaperone GroES [Candidatus Abawacabacteria bacterium RIFCSPHIGHO2_01_FULL_46_8]|uniref:Co-chaperonin GroES n=1 Tax=Candidatus Abawacabacteria bacterium RIFCSPHIGHO2_01_FULL_46_8 TaxID=1817815 RepID=A0A1F4XIJ8_9BACT|nr:MAG: co-chaperone GroES [Candidatus Abawacabacteria bacterium RIFCSPHIGHO2_01_FULL_46_8]
MATKLKPLGDNIIVRPASAEEVTASGIVIPDTASKEKPQRGEVIAVGPGKMLESGKRSAMEVKKGDQVLFTKYAPSEVKIEGEELFVLSASDIIAIIA